MKEAVEYISDEAGQRTAVVVPYDEWEKLRRKVSRLQQKVRVLRGIQQGIQEVRLARQQSQELQTLSAFLDEC